MKNNSEKTIYESLAEYCAGDFYPYHMPGHKRQAVTGFFSDLYGIDITEIDGFDNLHQAEGIIKDAQERANRLYGSKETLFLINGSTSGILASIMAVTDRNDEILIARNCHKSVYHAAILRELNLHYYYPPMISDYDIFGSVQAKEIEKLLDFHPNCKAVVITSPTYEGIISDVASIAEIVHKKGKILIVDEAHGAHLDLMNVAEEEKVGAIAGGADLVIHSLHKTLPAMTQTALLHINSDRIDTDKVRTYLSMIQTSSPSYIMMASIDNCTAFIEKEGILRNQQMNSYYDQFITKIKKCKHICAWKKDAETIYRWDIGKIVISVKDTFMTGQELYDILRDTYHLQMEMASGSYVLAMMTIMDTAEGWQRLSDAITEIDDMLSKRIFDRQKNFDESKAESLAKQISLYTEPKCQYSPAEAFCKEKTVVSIGEAVGKTSADFVNLYPPGIPLLVPGEIWSRELVHTVTKCADMGLHVQGVTADGRVRVVFP